MNPLKTLENLIKKGFRDNPENPVRGAREIRTPDPLLAKQMRYQLRHSPICAKQSNLAWAREDLNLRPHPYQGCALTT